MSKRKHRISPFTQGFALASTCTFALGMVSLWALGTRPDDAHSSGHASRGIANDDSCPLLETEVGSPVSVTQQPSRHSGCSIQVRREEGAGGQLYRTYTFSSDGKLNVFNYFKIGTVLSKTTGSRVYFMFPRRENISFEIISSGAASIRTADGQVVRIDPDTGLISSMSGAQYTQDSNISPSNKGGVEIKRLDRGILLDTGWQIGRRPESNQFGKSKFTDPNGASCTVNNKEVFAYLEGREVVLKHSTDEELRVFLSARCKNLDTSSLLPSPPTTAPEAPEAAPEGDGGAPESTEAN